MSPAHYLALSALLLSLGAAGVLIRRNAIIMFMSVELMLNAANLALVTAARMHGTLDGQVFAFFVIAVAHIRAVITAPISMFEMQPVVVTSLPLAQRAPFAFKLKP